MTCGLMQRRRESEGTMMGPIGPTSFVDALPAFNKCDGHDCYDDHVNDDYDYVVMIMMLTDQTSFHNIIVMIGTSKSL